jgi:hypothetical protein
MAQSQDFAPAYPLDVLGLHVNAYTGVFALAANLVVTLALTLALRAAGVPDPGDETRAGDYDELAEDAVYPERGAPAAPAQTSSTIATTTP